LTADALSAVFLSKTLCFSTLWNSAHQQRRSSPPRKGTLNFILRPAFFLLQLDQFRVLRWREPGALVLILGLCADLGLA
jgi:hypothetical protein